MNSVGIIGFGCAGYSCAEALRTGGYDGGIHVYSDGGLPPANPMLTTYYAAGKIEYEALFPFGGLEEICNRYHIDFHGGRPVEKLAAVERKLILADGSAHRHDAVLVATGARPLIPPIGEYPADRVFVMRTVGDAVRARVRMESRPIRRVVVVGASMVGIKVAELLSEKGTDCLLADAAPRIFPLAALPDIAEEIQRRVEARGISLRFGAGLTAIREGKDGAEVVLGGETAEADVVFLCIGSKPNLDILTPGELRVDKGILVDRHMAASLPGIYAAGDCCQGWNLQRDERTVIGLWESAALQGRTAGRAMAGLATEYPGSIFQNITHFMGMDFISFGDITAEGETVTFDSPDGGFRLRAVMAQDRPVCVNILDNHTISGPVKNYMVRRFQGSEGSVSPQQEAILRGCGLPPGIVNQLYNSKKKSGKVDSHWVND